MKYYLASNDLYVEMQSSVFKQIQLQAESEYPNENGGILVGRYSADRQASAYADPSLSRTHRRYLGKCGCIHI
jgi:hypothetical protein